MDRHLVHCSTLHSRTHAMSERAGILATHHGAIDAHRRSAAPLPPIILPLEDEHNAEDDAGSLFAVVPTDDTNIRAQILARGVPIRRGGSFWPPITGRSFLGGDHRNQGRIS